MILSPFQNRTRSLLFIDIQKEYMYIHCSVGIDIIIGKLVKATHVRESH
jgi:hypothetical protein